MSKRKQVYGFTGNSPEVGYAPYIMAFETEEGVEIEIRGHDGQSKTFVLEQPEANEMAAAISGNK